LQLTSLNCRIDIPDVVLTAAVGGGELQTWFLIYLQCRVSIDSRVRNTCKCREKGTIREKI
jgi:hypothetical protein